MVPKSNWHTVNCFSFKSFNTNSLFDDMFLPCSIFSCLLSYHFNMLWLIYIFIKLFIFFYHWSSRSRIPARSDGRRRERLWAGIFLQFSMFGSFRTIPWLLAAVAFASPRTKNKATSPIHHTWIFLISPLLSSYKTAAWRTHLSVPIGNRLVWYSLLKDQNHDFPLLRPGDGFLAR